MRAVVVSHLFPTREDPLRGSSVLQQVRALRRRMSVRVLSGVYDRDADEESVCGGVPVRYLALPWHDRFPWLVASLLATRAYTRAAERRLVRDRGGIDLIHAFGGYPDGVAAVTAARRHRVPVVVTLQPDDVHKLRLPILGSRLLWALSHADRVLCPTDRMRGALERAAPRLTAKLVTVPSGYDAEEVRYEPKPAARHLLFVGALVPANAPDLLLRAYARVAGDVGLPLVVVGDGPMAHWLRHFATELGVYERVRFLGRVPHERIGGLYREAKALVLPTSRDRTPTAVIESLSTGTPVVATDVNSIAELVSDDHVGTLVPVGDEAALAEALRAVARREYDAAQVRERAHALSWAEIAARVELVYLAVLERGEPAVSEPLALAADGEQAAR